MEEGEKRAILMVASAATKIMAPAVIGDHIEMTALHAGQLLYRLLGKGCVEKPDEKKNRYQISDKGKEFLMNPPAPTPKPVHKSAAPPAAPPLGSEEETKAEKKNDLAIPSQADIFRSVAEQLSISKQKDGTPSARIINHVQRTADLGNLSKLTEPTGKSKHLYRTTEKGKKYKANPPAEIEADEGVSMLPSPPPASRPR